MKYENTICGKCSNGNKRSKEFEQEKLSWGWRGAGQELFPRKGPFNWGLKILQAGTFLCWGRTQREPQAEETFDKRHRKEPPRRLASKTRRRNRPSCVPSVIWIVCEKEIQFLGGVSERRKVSLITRFSYHLAVGFVDSFPGPCWVSQISCSLCSLGDLAAACLSRQTWKSRACRWKPGRRTCWTAEISGCGEIEARVRIQPGLLESWCVFSTTLFHEQTSERTPSIFQCTPQQYTSGSMVIIQIWNLKIGFFF